MGKRGNERKCNTQNVSDNSRVVYYTTCIVFVLIIITYTNKFLTRYLSLLADWCGFEKLAEYVFVFDIKYRRVRHEELL